VDLRIFGGGFRIFKSCMQPNMLQNCGLINDRNVLYCDIQRSLTEIEEFPTENWLLFAIADKDQLGLLPLFAEKCLDKGVLYICGAGQASSEIDDAFDLVIVERKLASLNRDLTEEDFDDSPMTTWHSDFDEGFWFSVTAACHETEKIQHVIVANLTQQCYESRIKDLINQINSGWLPPD
jgi:hypothetical protein